MRVTHLWRLGHGDNRAVLQLLELPGVLAGSVEPISRSLQPHENGQIPRSVTCHAKMVFKAIVVV